MDQNKLYWLIKTRSLLGKRRENNRGRIEVHEFTIPPVESDNNTAFTYGGHPLRLFGQPPLAVIVEAPGSQWMVITSGDIPPFGCIDFSPSPGFFIGSLSRYRRSLCRDVEVVVEVEDVNMRSGCGGADCRDRWTTKSTVKSIIDVGLNIELYPVHLAERR